jgi:hypothetical protein
MSSFSQRGAVGGPGHNLVGPGLKNVENRALSLYPPDHAELLAELYSGAAEVSGQEVPWAGLGRLA